MPVNCMCMHVLILILQNNKDIYSYIIEGFTLVAGKGSQLSETCENHEVFLLENVAAVIWYFSTAPVSRSIHPIVWVVYNFCLALHLLHKYKVP